MSTSRTDTDLRPQPLWQRLNDRFVRYASEPDDPPELKLRKVLGLAVYALGIAVWPIYGAIYLAIGARLPALICMLVACIQVLCFVGYIRLRNYTLWIVLLGLIHMLGFLGVHFAFGGFTSSPYMDGAMLAQAIRDAGQPLPLVLFSSLGRKEAGDSVFAATLAKPLRQSQLFDTLVSLLAHHEAPKAAPTAAKPRMDAQMAERHPLRVLLAEDNVVNQKLALRLLQQMGYRADVAGNGIEAIECCARQPYDLVLMDVQMPEMDGLEASRRTVAKWPKDRPRIVAMTANAMQGDREECLAAGMDDYVTKPIRVDALVEALLRVVARQRQ